MIWKTITKIIIALLFVALMVAPIGALYYISALEQAKYLPQNGEQIVMEELAYGAPTPIMRMDMEERITLSGTVVSTKVIYEELELDNISNLRLLISTGQVLQAGDLIGYLDGHEVRATKTGIIRSINRGSDAYIELWSLEDLAIECYVDDTQLKVLKRGSLDLTDADGNKYTVAHIDEIRVGSDLTRVLLTSETAELIYGKKMEATNFNTGRVYPDCLVVEASCVYSYNGQDYYVRLVDRDGVVLGEVQVELGFSMNGYICITDGAQEGQLCDSGYKAIAEG